jgi:hypothetical protein
MKKSVRKPRTIPRDTPNPKAMVLAHLVARKVLDPEFLLDAIYEQPFDAARTAVEDCIRADWNAKGINKNNKDDENGLYEQAMFYIGVAVGQRLGGAR